jgi:WhiB family redox-sensing transcriptional regulator
MTLELLVAELRPTWQREAACRGRPSRWWFNERGGLELELARRLCAGCPVRSPCLAYALEVDDNLVGVWAGTTTADRDRMREAGSAAVVEELAAPSSSSSTPAPVAAWLEDAGLDRWHIGRHRPTYAARVLG